MLIPSPTVTLAFTLTLPGSASVEEAAALKAEIKLKVEQWALEREETVEARANLEAELEKRRQEQQMRDHLASAILSSAADGSVQRDDSVHFWQVTCAS